MRTAFDPADASTDAYGLLTSLVVPRPIAWVSTVDAEGVGNLAPHSFFTIAAIDPPMLAFTSTGDKDTARNCRATRHFVVNLASRGLEDLVNASSAPFAPDVDEARVLGIALEPSDVVPVPRVADAPASIECRVHTMLGLGDSTMVIGEVLRVSVEETALVDGRPSIDALAPVSRLGGDEWGLAPEVFRLTRPSEPPAAAS